MSGQASEADHLQLRRQWLMSNASVTVPMSFRNRPFADYTLHHHPDLQVQTLGEVHGRGEHSGGPAPGSIGLLLIGFILSPERPEASDREVLRTLTAALAGAPDALHRQVIARELHGLSGRYVLMVRSGDEILVFHDMGGMRSVYYSSSGNRIDLGSDPAAMLDQPSTDHGHELADEYARSRYVRRRPEHWIPSGISLYSGISHLRPNHLLTLPDLQVERYYPEHRSTEGDGSSVFDAAEILRGTMRALCNRTRVAVALSAGIDSRTVLAATRDLRGPDLTYHSYVFRKLTRDSPDVLIPRRLSRRLRLDHAEIRADQAPTGAFASAYERNVTNGHLAAWGPLVLAYSEALPSDTVIVDGGASEIARRSGSRLRPFPPGFGEQGHTAAAPTAADGASLVPGWRSFPRFIEVVEHWMDESKPVLEDAGYDPLDFFYWEFRVGSWLAQAYREYDIAQERFSPFSSRRLIELLLAHEPTERSGQLPRCHQEICGLLWPAVLELPVNPPTTSKRARDPFVDVLTSVIRPNGRPLRPTRLPGSGRGR